MSDQGIFGVKQKFYSGYFNIYCLFICLALLVLAAVLLGLEIIGIGTFIFLILLGVLIFIFF